MRIKVKKKNSKGLPYPKLMEYNGTIILAVSENLSGTKITGHVVSDVSENNYAVGHSSSSWVLELFQDLDKGIKVVLSN